MTVVQITTEQVLETTLRKKGFFLVPNKYLTERQHFVDIGKKTLIYKMEKRHECKCFKFREIETQHLRFLGIIYPSGRVVVKKIHNINVDRKNQSISFFITRKKEKVIEPFYLKEVLDVNKDK